jgi:hypothetical protein
MTEKRALPRNWMLAIATLQGLALFALYKSVETDSWPSDAPLWSFPLWTLAIILPVVVLLSLDRGNQRRVALLTAAFAAVLVFVAVYTGYQATPVDAFSINALTGVFALSVAIASYKVLMYLQQRASDLPLSYQVLFTFSWRNFLVTALGGLFVLAFWAVLALWGALFKVIEIDFFAELFSEDWFRFPVLSFAFGLGVVIFRELTRVIDNIAGLLRGLIKLLLPVVVLVATLFLLALPVTGLSVLWATGRGTSLLLWLTALTLFFVNAVYQDGRDESPYPAVIHRLVYAGLLTLLPVSAISLYGLVLRIDQYGLSVQRSWAVVVWSLLTLFALGYAWGILRRRDAWPETLARVNTGMGWVMLAILLLANSPLLDFRKLAVRSQLARVEAGVIERSELDFYYFSNSLARPGYLALEQIKLEIGDSDPALLARIENPVPSAAARMVQTPAEFLQKLEYRPPDLAVPPDLMLQLERGAAVYGQPLSSSVLLAVDLNNDGQDEYALLRVFENGSLMGTLYYRSGSGWTEGRLDPGLVRMPAEDLAESVASGEIVVVPPEFSDLEVGGVRLRVGPALNSVLLDSAALRRAAPVPVSPAGRQDADD